MTETAGATCPTCAAGLPVAGVACLRCRSGASRPAGPYASGPYASGPHPSGPFASVPYATGPVPPHPSFPPALVPYPARPAKSAGVAVLLTFLWIGAGHLYLDRVGTGVVLMAAHFVIGLLLLAIFAPLGFLAWLAAFITCSITCSNLAGAINAGTVAPRSTW